MAATTETIKTPKHLDPSELGTKQYWDAAYDTELKNHAVNPEDQGHVWFDESSAEDRVTRYLDDLAATDDDEEEVENSNATEINNNAKPRLNRQTTSFLDLGTGNGSMLRALREDEWCGEMLGVDYSEASVRLARKISEPAATTTRTPENGDDKTGGDEEEEEGEEDATPEAIRYEVWNLMEDDYESCILPRAQSSSPGEPGSHADARRKRGNETISKNLTSSPRPPPLPLPRAWDVVLDKGTFDAISLSHELDAQGRRVVEAYRERIMPLLARGTGLLVLTSCNWTEDELIRWFVTSNPSITSDNPTSSTTVSPSSSTAQPRPSQTPSSSSSPPQGQAPNTGATDDHDDGGGFKLYGRVKYPSFRFGGLEGQTVTTLCFRRT